LFRARGQAPHPGAVYDHHQEAFEARRRWQRSLAQAGWAAPGWPREWSRRDASIAQLVIYQEETALACAPVIVNAIGVWNIGPTILEHGTEGQWKRWRTNMLLAGRHQCRVVRPN